MWNTTRIAPPRSGSPSRRDADTVTCAVTSTAPVALTVEQKSNVDGKRQMPLFRTR
ncbi:MAG: hypothetical protein AAGA56_11335 [Myxococcota bacterium]